MTDETRTSLHFYASEQDWLNNAILYALRSGCFFPVPEPQPGASTQEWIQWGAMRNLHNAIAAFYRGNATGFGGNVYEGAVRHD